jgi:hypothetical protein
VNDHERVVIERVITDLHSLEMRLRALIPIPPSDVERRHGDEQRGEGAIAEVSLLEELWELEA